MDQAVKEKVNMCTKNVFLEESDYRRMHTFKYHLSQRHDLNNIKILDKYNITTTHTHTHMK